MNYLDALNVIPAAEVAQMLQGVHAADRRRMIEQALASHVGLNASTTQLKKIFEEWQQQLPIHNAQPTETDADAFVREGMRLVGGMINGA